MSDTEANDLPQVSELELLKKRADMMGISYSNNIGVDALKEKINAKMGEDGNDTSQKSELPASTPAPTPTPVAAPKPAVTAPVAPAATQAPTPVPTPAPVQAPVQTAVAQTASQEPAEDKDAVIRQLRAQLEQSTATVPATAQIAEPVAPKKSLRQYLYETQMKLVRVRITNLDPKKKDLPGEIVTVANEYLGTVRKFIPFGEHTDEGYHIPQILLTELEGRKFLSINTSKKNKRTGTPEVSDRWAKEFAIEILPSLTVDELNRLATAQLAAGSVEAPE